MECIHDIIERVPAWRDVENIQIERIAGLTNANYLVVVNGDRYVVRVSGQNAQRLGINRTHELTALRDAAQAGLAPEVTAYLPPEGHLVTRWVNGRHWGVQDFRTCENVRLLTKTVQCIHDLPDNGAVFSPFRRVESFLETAKNFSVPLPSGLNFCLQAMHLIEMDQQRDTSNWRRMCHNDLVSVNYLYIPETNSIKVLDWEFSGLGDIYYDLATVVYTHDSDGPIPAELEAVMLDCYFGSVSTFQQRRLLGMKFMLMLFTGMWGLAQSGMQKAGMIPAVDGFDYYEFAENLFMNDIQELRESLIG